MLRNFSCALVALLFASATPADDAPAPVDPVRAEFRVALDRVSQEKASADSAALRAYVLYPYLEAARLRSELAKIKPPERASFVEQRARAFLKLHADEPVARDLLHDWLAYLGERSLWAEFEAAAPGELSDLSLRCYAMQARLGHQHLDGTRDAIVELWLKEKDTPPACAPVFAWVDTPERAKPDEIEQRARFAAQNHVPSPKSMVSLPPERRALAQVWERLMKVPDHELQKFLAQPPPDLPPPPDAGVGDALAEAFDRVARRDSRASRPLVEPLRRSKLLNDEQRARVTRSLALGLAYDFDPEALQVFRELPENATDALSQEWRVRSALRQGDYAQALKWLDAMPPLQKQEVRWRYWRARLLEKARPGEALALYGEVAKEREYYAFLAAERLGKKPDLRPQPTPEDPKVQAALAQLPAMQRAHELVACDLAALATAELRYAIRDRSTAQQIQAAQLISSWGWHEPAVRILSELEQWDDLPLRFPMPFDHEVEAAGKAAQLAPEWIYAVVRTESLYEPRAASPAGAFGLLQLRLQTARQVAQRAGLPKPSHDDLFKPEVNLELGARYLRELLERFDQRFIVTLAAYNAGPLRAPYWLTRQPLDAEIWIETIPYNETRLYVQRALSNLLIITWRRTGEPAKLLPLLQPVALSAQDKSP